MPESTFPSTLPRTQNLADVVRDPLGQLTADKAGIARLALFIVLHIPLALLMRQYDFVSAIHAAIIFAVGLIAALRRPKNDLLHLWIIGYIVGAEVLWRATGAARILSAEQGRYVSALMIMIVMIRNRNDRTIPILPIFYLFLLAPSLLAYLGAESPFFKLRQWALGTLLGPIATALFAIYFARARLTTRHLWLLGIFIIAPIVGSATVGAYNVITLGDSISYFSGESNDTAAGFSANQVSNTLALGVILCWLLLFHSEARSWFKAFLILVGIGLAAQMFLTFSRGGIWTAGIAIAGTIPFLLLSARSRSQIVLLFPVVVFIVMYLVLPRLDSLTGGALGDRVVDTDSTSRVELAQSEIQVWRDNPVFGVGPGLAREVVSDYGLVNKVFQAHVEYTRVLAEHGILGLFALLILIVGIIGNFLRADTMDSQMWIVACGIFFFAYIGQAAFRTAAPSLLYGLTWAHLFASPDPEPEL